jgi:NADPH:quinone reductase-like Zn-dependent oxidoreductase
MQGWNEILRETGFNGLDFAMTDFEDPSIAEESILVASASSPPPAPLDTAAVTCLVDGDTPEQKELAEVLTSRLSDLGVACKVLSIQSLTPVDVAESTCISLLEVGRPFLASLDETSFYNLKHLMTNCKGVMWVSHSHNTPLPPEYALINGLARVLRAEYHLQRLVTLSLEPGIRGSVDGTGGTIIDVLHRMLSTEDRETEFEYSQRDGLLNIPRVIHSKSLNEMSATRSRKTHTTNARLGDAPALELHVVSPGLLNTTQFRQIEGLGSHELADDEVIVRTHAFGLTPRDYQIASGLLNEEELGVQCAGLIEAAGSSAGYSAGDRVCLVGLPACQTLLRCNARNVIKLADGMSFADGASLPAAAMMAVHCLINVARLESGETVLVQEAATTVGQIMVQLAQTLQARRVFVTAHNDEQRSLLRDVYNIPERDIFSKVGLATQSAILDATDGEGVDNVINSAADEELEASWNLLSPLGRFIHIGRRDVNVHQLDRGGSNSNTSFSRVNFAELLRGREKYVNKMLQQANTFIQDGRIRTPVGIEVFGAEDVEGALRFFQDGKEMGNSVVDLRPDSAPKVSTPKPQ